MRNFLAIFAKEMRSYLVSPIAYVVASVFLVSAGFIFNNIVKTFNQYCMTYTQQMQFGGGGVMPNLNEWVVSQFFGVMHFIWLFVTPMLTMRLYAEEKKTGTIELLATSPITTLQTLLGKFFACFALYAMIIALSVAYPIMLAAYGKPDWGPIISAYIGLLLMGAVFISVGVFASSLTENQIVAAVIAVCILLLMWLIDWPAAFAGPTLSKVLTYLSFVEHLRDFHKGVVDTKDAIFYVSLVAFNLFLTANVLESRRWRQ